MRNGQALKLSLNGELKFLERASDWRRRVHSSHLSVVTVLTLRDVLEG